MAGGEADDAPARWLDALEGTDVEPILRGFLDCDFQSEVARFVAERAPAFAVCCEDGSHPLEWTNYHSEYREMFERRLSEILQASGQNPHEVRNFVAFLHHHARQIEVSFIYDGLQPGDLDMFMQWLTSSEDYDAFLSVMLTAAREQPAALELSHGQPQEVEVVVPEGVGPGQTFTVEYLGVSYEVAVPEGFGPGMAVRVAVSAQA